MKILILLLFSFTIDTVHASRFYTQYFVSDATARDQIFDLQIEPTVRILPTAERVAKAVNHMIETQDASEAEVRRGIELLETLIVPPVKEVKDYWEGFWVGDEAEVTRRTQMRVNKSYQARFYLTYNLALLLNTYNEKYPGLTSSALSGLSRIAQYDWHSSTRRLATAAYVSLQDDVHSSLGLLIDVAEDDGAWIFDGKYDFYGTEFQILSSKNEDGEFTYRVRIPQELDVDRVVKSMQYGYRAIVSYQDLEGTRSEITEKGVEILGGLETQINELLGAFEDSSAELTQTYYQAEVKALEDRIEEYRDRGCDAEQKPRGCWGYRSSIVELDRAQAAGVPISTIQNLRWIQKTIGPEGEFTRKVKNPRELSNGVSAEASDRNRRYAKEILERLQEGQDTSFDTLFEIGIRRYRLDNLPRLRANNVVRTSR